MSNIDKRATELLIENGVLVADTLRHLADNEIDSDYFAICHTNENGTEIECELAITDYARQAAGTVDELVMALEAAEKTSTARLGALDRTHQMFQRERDRADTAEKRIANQQGIILSARQFISEYAVSGDAGAAEFVKVIDRAAGIGKGE